jgi:hypothetical protein
LRIVVDACRGVKTSPDKANGQGISKKLAAEVMRCKQRRGLTSMPAKDTAGKIRL